MSKQTQSSPPSASDQRIIDNVVEFFLQLTRIPRPSGHEKAVSDHIAAWGKARAWPVQQDELHNVIITIPASPGYEAVPTTILQAHMDMVCVADPTATGPTFKPEHDPIITVSDGEYMTGKGTSLGADDGIGIAIIQHIVENPQLVHGPLRLCITADEETSMTGADALDAAHLEGAFLINVDGEEAGTVSTSAADATLYSLKRALPWGTPKGDAALTVQIDGLRGGHSGMNIHEGRGNALRLLGLTLTDLVQSGIPVELSHLHGGLAQNAIPPRATATIILPAAQMAKAQSLIAENAQRIRAALQYTDAAVTCTCSPVPVPTRVTDAAHTAQVVYLMCFAHNGVYSMSPLVHGLVESSANLAIVQVDEHGFEARIFARSSTHAYTQELHTLYATLAHSTGCTCTVLHHSPGWPLNPESRLVPLAEELFAAKTGHKLRIKPIHAALECGYFIEKNPQLDVIALGPQLDSPHSPAEKLHLHTIPTVVHLIQELITRIATDTRTI